MLLREIKQFTISGKFNLCDVNITYDIFRLISYPFTDKNKCINQ